MKTLMKGNKMKTIITLIVSLFITSTLHARDTMMIVGSSTVYPYSTVVAERLGEQGFTAPTVQSTGTGGGMKLFCAGVGLSHPDVTNASRAMKSKEAKLCLDNGVTNVVEIIAGNDGIVFSNAINGPVMDITVAQLYTAMAHKVVINGELVTNPHTKWSDVDASLPNTDIDVMIAPPSSGTRDAWDSLVMKRGCKETGAAKFNDGDHCKDMREDGAVIEMGENDTLIVNKLAADPNKFGFFGYSYLLNNQDKIKPASINGVIPQLETIQSYEYPVARPLFYYIKVDHVGVVPGIHEYAELFISEEATALDGFLGEIGLVPLDEETMSDIQDRVENLSTMDLKSLASK